MLCDYAEEVGGKLYIAGGGFSRAFKVVPTMDLSIAGKVFVPWNSTNTPHTLRLRLIDADGQPVRQGPQQNVVEFSMQLEVGRPVGIAPGTEMDVPLVYRVRDINLDIGRYTWELLAEGNVIAETPFTMTLP
jgi:hypothetical protein